MSHVLVPLDGSEPSWAALDHAVENYAGDRITVLHVVDPSAGSYAGAEGGYYDPVAFDHARERGEELCEDARERLRAAGVLESTEFETAVEVGGASRTILEYAKTEDVDHVVIGSHGREGVSRILIGSVAERVTRRAPVPVTIVR
ncbi:universal stress protein [Natronococcus occultus]|uniref:Universal stress protein UspA-like protein n=1 Tax=Natronococcus occultus SP4 TaxID=694430 RepID=L0K5K2_9EURY|nr:universal stress protein [Natronococcus occultus]AGB39388.1 universal stress protein UspA-like protein [Natronococcus occultus SP4]